MTDFSKLTPEELERMDKHVLITIIGSLQGQLTAISSQLNFLTEQIALMNQRSFGRKTEQLDQMHQYTLFEVFNEPELLHDDSKEPEVKEVIISSYTRKKKTTREENLKGLPARVFEHKLSAEELAEKFPDGYKELPEEIYKRLAIIPQTFLVDEHHVHVYASKTNDGVIVKAKRPADVFRNSLATPSLIAAIATGKYQNHIPLERQSKNFKDYDIKLEPNTLANWMIRASEDYFSLIYDEIHKYLYDSRVVHADETPFEVIKDGRSAGSNSYMWVYRNGACDDKRPVVIYDYQPTRKADHPEAFLKEYTGTLVTDGYQVYHTLESKRKGLKVAGCWVHAKRKFAEIVKAVDKDDSGGIIAVEATKRISEIFDLENKLDDLTRKEREKQRQQKIKPKVDAFFSWAKSAINALPSESATYKGLQYCINQEQLLRVFLADGNVPMDNNRAEQAIRPFTLGRKNWVNMYSPNGAKASSIIYSLVETAKANDLKVYDYLELLITELSAHADSTDRSFITDLLPWSKTVQEKCHISKKS
ncbi:MAG: IS66 family transposase [Clostridiales bacterium]|nr:IS66 family transposase [Clostridiales bacterium]